jgi:glutathione S-transferase
MVQLIGMLDSPYVRRVAVSLLRLGLPFEHRPVSVFRGFATFQQVNPVVKAPSLVCDDGTLLMDSGLILDYAEALARPRSLMPPDLDTRRRDLHRIGLALAGCEKSAQIIYERKLRPPEKQHGPWIDRIAGQMQAAYRMLDAALEGEALPAAGDPSFGQAGICMAVAWRFSSGAQPEYLSAQEHPRLAAFSAAAEARPEFLAAPHDENAIAGRR